MRGKVYPYEVVRQQGLNLGATTLIQTPWPLGKPWHYIDLFFEITLNTPTATTPGTTVIADGLLALIKAISLWTPKNEFIWNNVPGRFGYIISIDAFGGLGTGGVPRLDLPTIPTAGNSAGPFGVLLRIPLWDAQVFQASDFILNTFPYSAMNFSVLMGNIGDMLGTPNATVISVAQLTIMLGQENTPLPAQPQAKHPDMGKYYESWFILNQGDPTAISFFDILRAQDVAYQDLFVAYLSSAASGQPFSGTPGDIGAKFVDFSLQDDKEYPLLHVRAPYLRDNYQAYIPTFSAQFTPKMLWRHRFNRNGSKQGALYSGDKALLRLTFTLPSSGGPAGGDQLVLGCKSWRAHVA